MTTPDIIVNMQEIRNRIQAGETIPLLELRAAMAQLRGARTAASVTSTKSRTKSAEARAAKKPIDSDDLLSELDG